MAPTVEIQERIDKCQRILDSDPNSQIFAALAEAYRRQGDLEKAFRICQSGLKIHPSYGSAHVVMAKINLDRRMYDWAEVEARKAAELDGWTRATELLLAEIHIYKGDYEGAVKLLKQLTKGDPDSVQIQRLLHIAEQLPRPGESQEQSATASAPPDQSGAVAYEQETPQGLGPAQTIGGIGSLLSQAIGIPGVDGALFVNAEGLIAESQWTLGQDANLYAATLCEIGNRLHDDLMAASWGHVRTVLVETSDRIFYLVRRADGLLVFVVDDGTNLGGLRLRLQNLLDSSLQE